MLYIQRLFGLKNLPKAKHEYGVVVPEFPPPADGSVASSVPSIEPDAEELDAMSRDEAEKRNALARKRWSTAVKRGLPRPPRVRFS